MGATSCTHKHTHRAHLHTPLASDTRILQPDIGDGLDVLSRQREAPSLSPTVSREKWKETHTHINTHTHTQLYSFHLKSRNTAAISWISTQVSRTEAQAVSSLTNTYSLSGSHNCSYRWMRVENGPSCTEHADDPHEISRLYTTH